MLTREELKAVHNNIITIMENRVMQMTGCNRQTANLVANEILDLDRDAELLNEKEADYSPFALSAPDLRVQRVRRQYE